MPDLTLKLDLTNDQFSTVLDVLKPNLKPGLIIEQWLESIPPSTFQQLWLVTSGDFATDKGTAFRLALIQRLHDDKSLW